MWLKEWNQNSKYFHSKASTRRNNQIISLCNESGERVDWEIGLKDLMTDYFTNLFCASDSDYRAIADCITPAVSETHNHELKAPILDKEVHEALFSMHSDKASGLDGMSPVFFQKHWDIIGKDVVDLVKRFFNTGIMEEQLNNTNIILIPKKKNLCYMGDLRHISLCDVLYKIILKVLTNMMKKVLDQIILVNQSSFI